MGRKQTDVVAGMFLSAAVAGILTQLAGVVATIIDGVITSRFFGYDAYSAISLIAPLTNIILLFASFISIGGQILCARKVGAGEKEEASAVFTFSALFGLCIALFFVAACLLVPEFLFRVCGVSYREHPELFDHMMQYLYGYIPGIPAVVLVQVLGPFLVIDNGKKLVSASAMVLCVIDVIGDFLNALVFHGGVMGMGLATAVAMWVQLFVLLSHYLRKKSIFRLSFRTFSILHVKEITVSGSLAFLRKLATILRDILINRINLVVAVGAAAVAAKGIQNDMNQLMFCIGLGIGKTLLSMTGLYYGAGDKKGLERLFTYAMKISLLFSGVAGLILFLFAPLIAGIYTGNPEVLSLGVFSIRCMALGLVFDTVAVAYQDYLQGVRSLKMVNFLCFAERFFIPVLVAFFLGRYFGSRGVMASIAVGKLVLVLMTLLILGVRARRFPVRLQDYTLLPEGFGGVDADNRDARIRTMEDVVRESEEASKFCLQHGVGKREAGLMALFVEEMAGNILSHGKPRQKGGVSVDYRLYTDGDRICLSLRDYCEEFDPVKYYEIQMSGKDAPESNIGIRLVMKLAQDIRYINTFNSNCIMISMEANETHA